MPDILFILLLALVVFGPKRLPEVAREIAKFMAQLRMASDDLKRQVQSELLKIEMEEKQQPTRTPAALQEPVQPPRSQPLPEGSVLESS